MAGARPVTDNSVVPDDNGQYPFKLYAWTSANYKGIRYYKGDMVHINHDYSDCHSFTSPKGFNDHMHSYKFEPLVDTKNLEIHFFKDAGCKGYLGGHRGPINEPSTTKFVSASSFRVRHYEPTIPGL
ncbi:hypothetical protein BV22DRAFT_1130661 [Leucogyrophana mollusca]|uniref:Uncharacterized protein n=1 Tax=Leucogyrophana mollusca TaxID=85980 RepID=A0ACB8BCD4_9AGAM|nr:hypothetical protein BV22DRAFT_1130661 [Leucogyrophana mollusca]